MPILLFDVGQIARPKRVYPDRLGVMRDWNGIASAQGWVTAIASTSITSALYFDPATSSDVDDSVTGTIANVIVWDEEAQAFVAHNYPTSALDYATVDGVGVFALQPDPTGSDPGSEQSRNLCRWRDVGT